MNESLEELYVESEAMAETAPPDNKAAEDKPAEIATGTIKTEPSEAKPEATAEAAVKAEEKTVEPKADAKADAKVEATMAFGPSHPTRKMNNVNAETSTSICSPFGAPNRHSRRISAASYRRPVTS